jgi:hypothetical protein
MGAYCGSMLVVPGSDIPGLIADFQGAKSLFKMMNSLRTDGGHRGRDAEKNCPKNLRLSKPTAIIIHWKVLEHILILHLVFQFTHFWGQGEYFFIPCLANPPTSSPKVAIWNKNKNFIFYLFSDLALKKLPFS